MKNFEDAKNTILHLLQSKGKATNRQMIRAIGGDKELFEDIREALILDDLAKDKDGVGLEYTGRPVESETQHESIPESDTTPQKHASKPTPKESREKPASNRVFIRDCCTRVSELTIVYATFSILFSAKEQFCLTSLNPNPKEVKGSFIKR